MVRDQSLPRSGRPAGLAALLGVAVLGVAVLAGCTSSSTPKPTTPPGEPWSVGSPNPGGSASPSGGTASGTGGGAPSGSASPGSSGVPGGTAAAGPPAQPSAEASRDGVAPSIAALPLPSRVQQVPPGSGGYTRAATGDGVWMISRPAGAAVSYAEVLHLDAAGKILRAYPFPGLAPQWLLITPQAVYCGRHGEAAAPDAMVCRIDRATGDLRVRVVPDLTGQTAVTEQDVAGRPGTWTIGISTYLVDLGIAPQAGTELTFRSHGAVLRLDVDTLGVLGS
jgi:hypothetical protein